MEKLLSSVLHNGDNPVVQNILRKKELLAAENPQHESIKTALVLSGGGVRGAFGAGVHWSW